MVNQRVEWVLLTVLVGVGSGCREPDRMLRARVDENLRRIASAQQKLWMDLRTDLEPLALKDFPTAAPWKAPVRPPAGPVRLAPGADGLIRERYELIHDPVGRERVLMAVLKLGGGTPKVLASQRVPQWFEVRGVAPSGEGAALECRALRVVLREEDDGPVIFVDEYMPCQVDAGAA